VSPVRNDKGKIVGASKIARDITEQRRSQEKIAALAREAEHRSRNLLASVRAVVQLSHGDTPESLKQAIEGRIRALANVNSLFVASRWIGAELSAIAVQELAPFSEGNKRRVLIDGPPTLLEPNKAQAIAVILHELATNAAKYGSLSNSRGRIDLTWQQESNGALVLHWKESGGPTVTTPSRQGFGSKVIKQMAGQLGGEARFDWNPDGLICTTTFVT
jgi:two-component sensor histidine kinase